MNQEGYKDDTAEKAIKRTEKKPPDTVIYLVHTFRHIASLCGYDITNRIEFLDRRTGKEWK
jgi:hypothetical protein